jgi:hypothetical protein
LALLPVSDSVPSRLAQFAYNVAARGEGAADLRRAAAIHGALGAGVPMTVLVDLRRARCPRKVLLSGVSQLPEEQQATAMLARLMVCVAVMALPTAMVFTKLSVGPPRR